MKKILMVHDDQGGRGRAMNFIEKTVDIKVKTICNYFFLFNNFFMKNEFANSFISSSESMIKTLVNRSSFTPNVKYIPSQERIRALEIAYVKKVREGRKRKGADI